jgi:quercetin 2,3-dioxygenase
MEAAMDQETTSRARRVVKIARGTPTSDGAGVKLTRLIGTPALPEVDPFLLLDAFGSDKGADYIGGFPDHPHRGFETVTYMLAGRMRHGDHMGNVGLLGPGSVQWMTAARGIIHSEMPEQEDGLMMGFQLWVNLPAKDKMGPPRYQDIAPERIPVAAPAEGVRIKVLAGKVAGVEGPVGGVATEPVALDVAIEPGAHVAVPLPRGHAAFATVFEGAAEIGDRTVTSGEIVVLGPCDEVLLGARDVAARVFLVAGKPLHEPVVRYGPFVMNTEDQIREAIEDYRAGRF